MFSLAEPKMNKMYNYFFIAAIIFRDYHMSTVAFPDIFAH